MLVLMVIENQQLVDVNSWVEGWFHGSAKSKPLWLLLPLKQSMLLLLTVVVRDANEKNLIRVLKVHTDENVADLLTKAFDGPRFNHLVVHIGMLNPEMPWLRGGLLTLGWLSVFSGVARVPTGSVTGSYL
ncbi:hypothetical protein Tco_1422847 [Tanacetum coccineum]